MALVWPLLSLIIICLHRAQLRSQIGVAMANIESPVFSAATDIVPGSGAADSPSDIPLLPPPVVEPEDNNGEVTRQFQLGGDALKLDHLGPIIINTDGTTRRISNWDTLSKQEQASTWRLISARNRKRLEELKKQQVEQQAVEAADSNTDLSTEAVSDAASASQTQSEGDAQ